MRSLIKQPNRPMKNHINQFSKHKEARDLHAPADITPLSIAQVNLAFLNSLDPGWKLFHQALGDNAYMVKTGELFARVEVLDRSESPAKTQSPADGHALVSRTDDRNKNGQRMSKRNENPIDSNQ